MTPFVRLPLGTYGFLTSLARFRMRMHAACHGRIRRKWLGVQTLQTCYQSPSCPIAGGALMRAGERLAKPEVGHFRPPMHGSAFGLQ
jgi:hypothetical protein